MRWLLLLPLLAAAACGDHASTTTTSVYDPGSQAIGNYWQGIFWTSAAIGATICLVVWAICWAITEGRKR